MKLTTTATLLASLAFSVAAPALAGKTFPLHWTCNDSNIRVDISPTTGELTIRTKNGKIRKLPYAGAMSNHHGWGNHTECYADDAPCAQGYVDNGEGDPALFLTLTPKNSDVPCRPRR